ncbi:uncharacterized protein LOC109714365 [Ananas comosus]|uniref:Uncharacterized protein LOC109714365 n=1 Tax=Ananas comosus TaxID=4615 RepID=A0A6P5FG65_ANACO|nr:uncharacterized protein LOC109714365 [Ananas comosus]
MEARKDTVGPAGQRFTQGSSSSSTNMNTGPPEYTFSSGTRPVLNYSIQTGEEFALEFMRERAMSKKHSNPTTSSDHNITSDYMDLRGMLGISYAGSESGSDVSMLTTVESRQLKETEKKSFSESQSKIHFASTRSSAPRASSGDGSSRGGIAHTYTSTDSSDPLYRKMKILCSFGGKILPRPSDGKLRYVGGDTRILRLNRDIPWQELVQKTMAVYNQPHIIKYQLPGEDLDALVSVSCDEDLQNMMEECNVLECDEGSQKLRMFLFASSDFDDTSFNLGSMEGDSEYQYVVAVNGINAGARKASSGHGLASTSGSDLDQLLNLNFDTEQINTSREAAESVGIHSALLFPPPTTISVPSLSSDFDAHLQSYHDRGMQYSEGSHYGYMANTASDHFYSIESRVSIPLSVPSDYGYTSHYAPSIATSAAVQPHNDSSALNYVQTAVPSVSSTPDHLTSILPPKEDERHLEAAPVLSSTDVLPSGSGYEHNEDDGHSSVGAFTSGFSDYEGEMADHSYKDLPHPARVFHSERIPREQGLLLSRLSKSDNSLGSQFLMLAHESIAEAVDSAPEQIMVSEGENPSAAVNKPNASPVTSEDGSVQSGKYKELSDALTQMTQSQPIVSTEQSTNVMSGDKGNKVGWKAQKPESVVTSISDKSVVNDDRVSQETSVSRRNVEKVAAVAETVIAKNESKDLSEDQTEAGATLMQQETAPTTLPDVNWEEISAKTVNATGVENDSDLPWVGEAATVVSQEESSVPSKEKKDILIDINDRFPPQILSDFFTKARIAAESSSVGHFFKDDAGLSLNMQNHEPKRWSFFRNIAQDEFARKDVSLMDQDLVGYLSLLDKGAAVPTSYQFVGGENEGIDFSQLGSQIDFEEVMQHEPSTTTVDDSTILHPDYISSQIGHLHLMEKSGIENPFPPMRENPRPPISEYEVGETVGPILDVSLGDIDLSNLQIIKNEDLEELRELGSGTFGTVYHGKWRGTDVAIKRIKKSCFTGRSSEQERLTHEFWREAEILSKLHHPNVVAFYGVVQDGPGGTLATVTEFMVNGSLRHVLLRKDKYLDRRKRLIIAMDAAFGMEYLHSKNIVHFDLKCDNLLVNLKDQTRPICKVGDFGLSKIKRNTLVSGGVRGTLPWMAPELLNGSSNKVSEKVDVFSFGIVMWEILTGDEPYANMHYGAIIGGIVNNTLRPPVPATCDLEWRKLMELCWAPDPAQRPSFTEIASRLRSMSVASQTKPSK